jgi:hypothetical protein
VLGSVDMRAKGHAVVVDLTPMGKGENLKTTAIGQQRIGPTHKGVRSAQLSDQLRSRTQHQVVGVGQNDPGAGRSDLIRCLRFDERLGANGHEYGSIDHRSRGCELSATRRVILRDNFKFKAGRWQSHHPSRWAPWISIASP